MRYSRVAFTAISIALCAVVAHAGEIIPLKNYDSRGSLIYYREKSIAMQAARFDLAGPGALHRVTVTLGGAKGTARLHLFGGEGGLNAPWLEQDLVAPVNVVKTRSGIEKITITFPEPVAFNTPQLYVMVDDLSSGVRLLSDRKTKKPACRNGNDLYYYQLIKDEDGWRWGKYGYAIELGIEFNRTTTPTFADVTADVKLPDSALWNHGIAWADVNNDGYLDLLAGGRLFRNNGGSEFTDITASAGINEHPNIQGFIDANGDAWADMFLIGDSGAASALLLNDGGGNFVQRELSLAGVRHPACFSVADINGDNRLDLFVGGYADTARHCAADNLFLNQGNGRFVRDTVMLRSQGKSVATIASQWVDYDNNGTLDLFTVDAAGVGTIWRNIDGRELLPGPATTVSAMSRPMRIRGSGCAWVDCNNDGMIDLLLPGPAAARPARDIGRDLPSPIALNGGPPAFELDARNAPLAPEYLEHRSGGAAGDVDNDGLVDVILTTSCDCSYLDLYRQSEIGTFEQKTYQMGLWRVSGGPDAVWVDYDNDGRLDLSIVRNGRIALYRNTSASTGNNYVELDLDDAGGTRTAVGAGVTVHCGDARYTRQITSGRGLGMQDPLRLHIGLGAASTIDSVTVRWPNSATAERFTDLAVNERHLLKSGRTAGQAIAEEIHIQASPNPFSERLELTYTLPHAMRVRLEIYSSAGELVEAVLNEDQDAGRHTVLWGAKDRSGHRLPQGTYVYRLITPAGESIGKAVLRI